MEQERQQDPRRELLEPHADKKIRTFIGRGDEEDPAVEAFFSLLYEAFREVDYSLAVKVGSELSQTDKTVRDFLDGWRPVALRSH